MKTSLNTVAYTILGLAATGLATGLAGGAFDVPPQYRPYIALIVLPILWYLASILPKRGSENLQDLADRVGHPEAALVLQQHLNRKAARATDFRDAGRDPARAYRPRPTHPEVRRSESPSGPDPLADSRNIPITSYIPVGDASRHQHGVRHYIGDSPADRVIPGYGESLGHAFGIGSTKTGAGPCDPDPDLPAGPGPNSKGIGIAGGPAVASAVHPSRGSTL